MKIVSINEYIKKREKQTMCQKIIEEIICSQNNDEVIYYASDMEPITTKILKEVNRESVITPVVKIAKKMNFDTFQKKLLWFLSGYIGINEKYIKKYNTDHIICTNINTHPYQQRFVIAHELAHFLFDYDHKSAVYYNTYIKNSHNLESERRANSFAANLLMPKDLFIQEYKKAVKISTDPIFVMVYLSDLFKAPRKAVLKRMSEVGCYAITDK